VKHVKRVKQHALGAFQPCPVIYTLRESKIGNDKCVSATRAEARCIGCFNQPVAAYEIVNCTNVPVICLSCAGDLKCIVSDDITQRVVALSADSILKMDFAGVVWTRIVTHF
jgi:hypothetical protein